MTAKASKRQCILNSLMKIKANILEVCEWMKPTRNSTTGKFIYHYKPDMDGDDQTAENAWPFLNLPGKEESTWIINHRTSNCRGKGAKAASQKHRDTFWGKAGSGTCIPKPSSVAPHALSGKADPIKAVLYSSSVHTPSTCHLLVAQRVQHMEIKTRKSDLQTDAELCAEGRRLPFIVSAGLYRRGEMLTMP